MPWPKASSLPLTADRLRELLSYDPETGEFTRLVSVAPRALAGQKSGDLDSKGYIRLRVDGKRYLGHRLAWFYMTGEWPPEQIDHRNGSRTDNRFTNLRLATAAQNLWNSTGWKASQVAFKGVTRSHSGGFRARIRSDGKERQIGVYPTPEEAKAAYDAVASALHGEFAKVAS